MVMVESRINWNANVVERFKAAARVNGVSVGYKPGTVYPTGESVGMVARTQEFGTHRIPPRPFVRPTIVASKRHWGRMIAEGLRNNRTEDTLRQMWTDRGKEIVGDIQASIDRVMTPPLAPYTIARRKQRGNESTKPLVDTGVMRNDLGYKVNGGEWEK